MDISVFAEVVLDLPETQEGSVPKLVCGNLHIASEESCRGKERASNPLTMECSRLPENPLHVPGMILGVRETRKEFAVAPQSNASVEQKKAGLLLREAPTEKKPQGSFSKQFAATDGCKSDVGELTQGESLYRESNSLFGRLVSVSNCQGLSEVSTSIDLALESPSVDRREEVSGWGGGIVREIERPCSQVAGLGQQVLQADSLSKQAGPQGLRREWVTGFSEQNSLMPEPTRMQGRAGKRSSLDTWDLFGISLKQGPVSKLVVVVDPRSRHAGECLYRCS